MHEMNITSSLSGTCGDADITECCEGDFCLGEPDDCYCDVDCYFLADCCQDINDVCTFGEIRPPLLS